ncbi:MAG: DUF3048 domain-containing protein [Clostridium sp.]|nr:DUF3048 domain-containing protein [Acetatifactor muris]MCM1526750.1 DUF3048 domain-containing protein [Bacteroides sp.]MCM1562790.1 DUF3048 domain-containing protein [Clostridium sp.]
MKLRKLSIFFIAVAILLGGCDRGATPGPILSENDYLNENNHQGSDMEDRPGINTDIQIVTEDDTLPPREGMVRSRLTNEWVDEEVNETRPIAVMVPNESGAIPHYNLSKASVLYEANMEGRVTRLMAVFEDWEDLVRIGNIRSARTYFAYWAFEWDAFFVHYGGPYYINELMDQEYTENIDGLGGDGNAFYRSKDRPEPHNVYADGDKLLDRIERRGYSLSYRDLTDESHFLFATKAEPNTLAQYGSDAHNAAYIDMSGCYPLTRCYFEYNDEDGLYYRSQHLSGATDEPHTDADGVQLSFKNILVQYTKQETLDDKGYLVLQCHDDTRDGWFFTNGRGIHVNWAKDSDYGVTKYYDDYGNEITLNTGKTMICIVNENDSFTFR